MTGDRDEALGRLTDELAAALADDESIVLAAWAERFGVGTDDVAACVVALQALENSLGEEPTSGAPELPPPQLPDDYELLGELGRGGMGVVYRARQRSLGREIAIKVLRPGELMFGEALRRFRNEAQSLARLRHRHIVSIHDLGEGKDGTLWFTMDLIDGHTLADELAGKGRMLPARAVRIVRQVAAAIAHAHAHGIVHRDLKPQNVLLDHDGDAFVVDFGLARDAAAAGTRTLTGELLGTPAYMSPEQARGEAGRIGEASDVWALGALLYEMLTGRGPFAGKPLHATIRAILEEEPTAPRAIDKRIPHELEAISLQALQKRPEARYDTALAFAEDVERFADGRPVLARRPGPLVRTVRLAWRNRRGVALVAAAVLFTLLLVSAWLPSLRRAALRGEIERLLEIGEPVAALASARGLLGDTTADDAELVEFLVARAANDVAAAKVRAGDRAEAESLLQEASKLAERHVRAGEALVPTDLWTWELARAFVWQPAERTRLRFDEPLRHRVHEELRHAQLPRVLDAALLGSVYGVSFDTLGEAERLRALDALVTAAARRLQAGDGLLLGFPWELSDHELDAWWTPAVEERLAELAVRAEATPGEVVVALRALGCFCGLDLFEEFGWDVATGVANAAPATVVRQTATRFVQAWRQWRTLPREQELVARADLLVEWIETPGTTGIKPRASSNQLEKLLGRSIPGTAVSDWWRGLRVRPFAALLREAVGLADGVTPTIGDALDQARTAALSLDRAKKRTRVPWQQLAWLQVPEGKTFLRVDPARGLSWRASVLAAAGLEDPRRFVVHAAVLRFDDGAPEPRLVAQGAVPGRLGAAVQLTVRAEHGDAPWLSSRRPWEDEGRRASDRPLAGSRGEPIQMAPRLGELMARARGRLDLTAEAKLRFEVDGSMAVALPDATWRENLPAPARVGLGETATCGGLTVWWDSGRRVSTFLLLTKLVEGDDRGELPLLAWRDGVVRHWQNAVEARRGVKPGDKGVALQGGWVDWVTPAWWPMPELASAFEAVLRTPAGWFGDAPNRERGALTALRLAGVPSPAVGPGADPDSRARVLEPLRIAVGTGNAEMRAAALAPLSDGVENGWTPALAATLRDAAARGGFAVPAAVQQRLDAMPEPDGLWDRLVSMRTLYVLGWMLVVGWILSWRRDGKRRRELWGPLALLVAVAWIGVRLQIGGVVCNPTFVGLAASCALTAAAPQPWTRLRITTVAVQLLFVGWAALAWFGQLRPPYGLEVWIALAILLSGITLRFDGLQSQRPRLQGRAADRSPR